MVQSAHNQFKPGEPVQISALITRVLAPNASMMTGPGTNSYLVGKQKLAVIDPGPNNPEHIDAIIRAAEAKEASIEWILCTHTHPDHSPGNGLLQQLSGARSFGQPAPQVGQSQDRSYQPDSTWQAPQDSLSTEEFTLTAIHTPGHASNHWCYFLQEEQTLFSGDHIMDGSTVVIAPPDGDMGAYMKSLQLLTAMALDFIAPGHGNIISDPQQVIQKTIAHRLQREEKTLEKLAKLQAADLAALVAEVYDDVPEFLHPMAKSSLTAHLEKLRRENRVQFAENRWEIT